MKKTSDLIGELNPKGMAISVERRAERYGLYGKGVTLKITYADMKGITRSKVIETSRSAVKIYKAAASLLEKNRAWLIPSDLMTNNLANDLTELIRRNKKDTILALLKLFDERINGIEILTDDVYISFEGMAEMLPARVTGDGLRRYLSIVASAANPLIDMILIDEIDNGLHYSVYRKLWQALFTLAVASDKQLFVTTHSKETLCHLSKMLEENINYQKDFRLYTLEKTKLKGHQAYKLTYNGLCEACTNDIELRSIVL